MLSCDLFCAQACWVLRYFCELKFRTEANLVNAMAAIKTCLLSDKDLPVRVEAALAIQMLITEQEKGRQCFLPLYRPDVTALID